MRRTWLTASVCVLVLLVIVLVILPIHFPWSPLNCWHEDVDISSGRIRLQWYLLYVKVSDSVQDTSLSRVIASSRTIAPPPQWHRVNTFSPGVHYSPHYYYHGAGFQIRELAEIWALPEFPKELQPVTAQHVLALWQEGGYHRAGDYIQELYGVLETDSRKVLLESLRNLEVPRYETRDGRTVKTLYYPSGLRMERFAGYLALSGEFVEDGAWESWYENGQLKGYGRLRAGKHDGQRFSWDRKGQLIAIEAFENNELTEYESEALARHPDFALAQMLFRDGQQTAVSPQP